MVKGIHDQSKFREKVALLDHLFEGLTGGFELAIDNRQASLTLEQFINNQNLELNPADFPSYDELKAFLTEQKALLANFEADVLPESSK